MSSAFEPNGMIPPEYTCDGDNLSPPLIITDVPEDAQSLILFVEDPDAPAKPNFTHWATFNIDPTIDEIKEGEPPRGGVEGMTDFGKPGYGGPCPPSGIHRYVFRLYALDTNLELPEGATKEEIKEAMDEHILDEGELIGRYGRSASLQPQNE